MTRNQTSAVPKITLMGAHGPKHFETKTDEGRLFTGLIEEKGVVAQVVSHGNASDLTIAAPLIQADAAIGDSISVNGCCLTVVKIENDQLTFQAGSETLQRTNLGTFATGTGVNLERSLKVGQRMGGHYVSGHIDATATVDQRSDDGEWAKFWFRIDSRFTAQMASKGSVAIDGISLTLVDVTEDRFSVELIPHTLDVTTMGDRHVGDTVNIETDLLAKYVQQQLSRSAKVG